MSQDSVLKTKSFNFAARTINLHQDLKKEIGWIWNSSASDQGWYVDRALVKEAEFAEVARILFINCT